MSNEDYEVAGTEGRLYSLPLMLMERVNAQSNLRIRGKVVELVAAESGIAPSYVPVPRKGGSGGRWGGQVEYSARMPGSGINRTKKSKLRRN